MATQAAVDTNRPRAEETEAFLQQRIAAFTRIFTPQDEAQEIEIAQTVLASIRLEHYQLCEVDRRIEIAQIARDPGSAWDEARQQEASCLGKTLKRDPEIVMMSLRETPAGRAWLITQWEALLLVIDSGGELIWTDGESNRALDLMGTSRDYRAALIKCRSPFADPVATRVLILERIAMLKTAQQRDKADNDRLRSTHVRGLVTHGDAKINLIRRCEREAQRRYDRNLKSLYKAKAAQAKAAKEQPAPAYETKPNPGVAEPPYETKPNPRVAEPPCETKPNPGVAEPPCETKPNPGVVEPPCETKPNQVAPRFDAIFPQHMDLNLDTRGMSPRQIRIAYKKTAAHQRYLGMQELSRGE